MVLKMQKIAFLKILFILCIVTHCAWGNGPTLSSIEQYAQTLSESPASDTDNFLNPDYTHHLQEIVPGFWEGLLDRIRGTHSFWTKGSLNSALEIALQKSPFMNKDLVYLSLKTGDQLIVWGDIHGTFHSLIRCLKKLKEDGILDNDLKLRKENVKLIFMGNIIDRSAYSIDTLMLVLTLMNQNPQQVIYMRASHENNENWLNYDFKREIAVRLGVASVTDPFVRLFNKFCAALPSQIFANLSQDPDHYLVFNSLYNTSISALLKIKPTIDILFTAQSRSNTYQTTEGLDLLPPEQGIPTWTLFSSPSRSFQKLYKFYNDSFTIITIGDAVSSSYITLYQHDVRTKSPTFIQQNYQIASGELLAKGEYKNISWLDLPLGSPIDLTETSRILGQRLRVGMDLRFRKLNREGGINGKMIRVYYENDHYLPSKTLKIATDLIEKYSKPILLSTLGTQTTLALLPVIQDHKLLLMFPYTGDSLLRKPDLTNILHYRPSYDREINALIKYAKDKLLKQRFAIFYLESSGEQSRFSIAKDILQKNYDVPDSAICSAAYQRGTINIDKAAESIKNCNPDAIILISSFDAAKALVNKLGVAFLKNVTLLGYSFLSDRFRDFVSQNDDPQQPGKGLEFIISRVIPNPNEDQSEIVKEYREEIKRIYPGARYDVDSLEGYINASILIDVLQKMDPPYSTDKIIQAIEAMKSYSFKGLILNFDPETRELSKQVWIDSGEKHWLPVDFEEENKIDNKKSEVH